MKILVVEDNISIARNITQYLQLEGYDVDMVHDGKEGLEKALSHAYELLIVDRMLPSMDGVTLCKTVREKKSIPIIMTTAK